MIELDGHLTVESAESVVFQGVGVRLSPAAWERLEAAHQALRQALRADQAIYGVNTGLGALSRVRVPPEELAQLQLNLVRSHAVGVGEPLPERAVRAVLLFRLNSFLQGASGVRPELAALLGEMLNRGVYPVIPSQGSVGASGDLAPLAHLALVLIGEGRARFRGEELPGGEALRRAGLAPLSELQPKEGLALLNGTSVMLAQLFCAWVLGRRAFAAALGVSALSFQALRGHTQPLDPRIHALRPHPGQVKVAEALRALLAGSSLTDTFRDDVQDPYSLRCLPQILGPVWEVLARLRGTLETEMNAATDNPLVLPGGEVLCGGNFHGQVLALAAEELGMALAVLGGSCERRLHLLLNAPERGLPPFLAARPGRSSGLMLLQYAAAALAAENKVLAHPAAVDSLPTSGGKEDHNPMGATSCWKALRIATNVAHQVALEAIAARWAVALQGEAKLSPATRDLYRALAEHVPPPGEDRPWSETAARLAQEIAEGRLGIHGV
ncbi:histidine ammonia-lyase [Thermus sp.]|uniref:histidine ammonia-lyase n=1 Tax=Thermus sp. TaxID=275 RepID=UPI0026331DE7|nr:histidine ammonia-lyase [Thermus sp.]MCX7850256.1 histidine ammonia-lyase [Thermus sp.]